MWAVQYKLKGISPLSFSRVLQSVKPKGETDEAFADRTWREHIHTDSKGAVVIPPNMLKACIADCAKYFSEKIKGKGNNTWSKHFEAGIMIVDPMPLMCGGKPILVDAVKSERLFLNADGKKGGGTRVWRIYPYVTDWECAGQLFVFDPVFDGQTGKIQEYMEHAGQFIGMGRWRPRKGGMYGRFNVTSFKVDK